MTAAADVAGSPPLEDEEAQREVRSSDVVWQSGRVIDVRTDRVRTDDGEAFRDVVVHPGAVGIIALDDEERVALIQQYRHPVRRLLWEPPAGLLDVTDEPPLESAQRELYEEAHLEADSWAVLIDLFTSPGMTDEAVRIYLARGVRESTRDRHQGEHEEHDLPLRWASLDDAVAGVLAGRIHNPIAASGLLAAAAARGTGWRSLRPAEAPWPEMSRFVGSTAGQDGVDGAE